MTQTFVSLVPEVIDINSYHTLDEQASKKDKILNNCDLQVIKTQKKKETYML